MVVLLISLKKVNDFAKGQSAVADQCVIQFIVVFGLAVELVRGGSGVATTARDLGTE